MLGAPKTAFWEHQLPGLASPFSPPEKRGGLPQGLHLWTGSRKPGQDTNQGRCPGLRIFQPGLLLSSRAPLSGTANDSSAAAAKLLQLCPTLCDPVDSSPPGSPIPGILQARTLEWVAISFSNT